MKKPASRPTSSHKANASTARDKISAASVSPQVSQTKDVKREHASFGETDADEESLRLIRELQEQDFGLRRRAARV
jgi:F-box/leucine-rich repeat protein 10/11